MRKIVLFLLLSVSLSVFSMACADDEGLPIDGQDTTQEDVLDDRDVSEEGDAVEESDYRVEYSEPYAQAVCARIFSCCPFRDRDRAAELMGTRADFSSEEECVSALTDAVDASLQSDAMHESLESGRRVYREANIEGCLNEIEVASCGDGLLPDAVATTCASVFEAQGNEGEDCAADGECREGYCADIEKDEDGNVTVLGVCQSPAPGEVGGECDMSGLLSGSACVEGSYCHPETFICEESSELGEACEHNRECASGTYCDETCKTKHALGEVCTPGSCDAQTYCDTPGFGESGEARCEPRKAIGEVCDADSDEVQCAPGGYCSGSDVARCSDLRDATQVCLGIE